MRAKSLLLLLIVFSAATKAQELQPTADSAVVVITLKNIAGGVFSGQQVTVQRKGDSKTFTTKSNMKGEARLLLPVGGEYAVTPAGYPKSWNLSIPPDGYSEWRITLSYQANAADYYKRYTMTDAEKSEMDAFVSSLPDTTLFRTSAPPVVKDERFAFVKIYLQDADNLPLQQEMMTIVGRKSHKGFKGATGTDGRLAVQLPKGDTYDIHFKYDRNFQSYDIPYMQGTYTADWSFRYIGTRKLEQIKKEEAKKMAEEKLRLDKERKEFALYMKRQKLNIVDANKKAIDDYVKGNNSFVDQVILKVFERNKHWKDKLIVCDLTGSMAPYYSQLLLWYGLNHSKEQNLQFVFFNDGDDKPDEQKVIGNTGGIYYTPAIGYEKLQTFMAKVAAAGGGGDVPENNMEALIKGVKMANKYKELVMVVDNHSPVKDIELLKEFHLPVRIILCGMYGEVETDYLHIAWETGGSVHTMEQDIIELAKLTDGQEIVIAGTHYKLMKNRFVVVQRS